MNVSKKIIDELVDFKDKFLAGQLPSPSAMGPNRLSRNSIKATTLSSVSSQTGNLTISGALTLGPNGSITDSDGSSWTKDGITLVSTTVDQDFIRIINPSYDHAIELAGFIQSANANVFVRASYDDDNPAGPQMESRLGLVVTDTDGSAKFTTVNGGSSAATMSLRSFWDTTPPEFSIYTNFLNNLRFAIGANASSVNWQSGQGIIYIMNRNAAPTGNPSSGGFLYVESGALKYRGSSGTITTIANA